MMDQLSPDSLLEPLPLLHRQAIALRNDRHDIHHLAQFLHHYHVDGAEGVTGGRDEVEAAVDARVDDVAVAHGGKLLAEVGGVLVFDVFDYGVPATLVVHLVGVARGVDDVQAELDAVLDDD